MKRYKIATIIAVVLLGLLTGAAIFEQFSKPQIPVKAVEQQKERIYTPNELLTEANRLRAEKGVAPLVLDERLNQSAQWKADDMAKFDYFGHVKPGESVNNGAQKVYDGTRLQNGKSECAVASENLNSGDVSHNPFDTISGWPTSKLHYEAILADKYETTGFGISQDGTKTYYVQHFCDLK